MSETFRSFIRNQEVINPETGEIKAIYKTIKGTAVDQGEFYQVYSLFLLSVLKIRLSECVLVLSWLASNVEYGTNQIELTSRKKKILCKDLDMSIASFYNYWRVLKNFQFTNEKGELEHVLHIDSEGLVTLNPKIVWKGSIKQLHEFRLRMEADFLERN